MRRLLFLNLLDRLFRARLIQYWPERFLTAWFVAESAFRSLVERIERELKEKNSEKARQDETEIIQVARELGLGPRPTGTGPNFLYATCPCTNHAIYIDAVEAENGYGYCGRKGSPDDLREFVKRQAGAKNGVQAPSMGAHRP